MTPFARLSKQHYAVDPSTSCWVEASAGTGKTKVLVDRVLSLLLQGVPASKILCLTFTKAAAAEMLSRIQEKLVFWAQCNVYELSEDLSALIGEDVEKNYRKQARSLFGTVLRQETLKVQTVHAFCQFLLKSFPLEAGLIPHFKIMDAPQTADAKQIAFEKAMKNASKMDLDRIVSSVSLYQLEEIFLWDGEFQVLRFLKNKSLHELDLGIHHLLNVDSSASEHSMKEQFLNRELISWTNQLPQDFSPKDKHVIDTIKLSVSEKLDNWGLYQSIFLTHQNTMRQQIVSKKFSEQFPDFSQMLVHHAHQLQNLIITVNKVTVAHLSHSFYRLGKQYLAFYEEYKKKNAYVDYNDLIDKSIQLLENASYKPWIFYKLEGGIDHILIDEAQDTSQEQWLFIQHLVEEFFAPHADSDDLRTLFVVGDCKQSIYSFQGADPGVFQKMKHHFGHIVQQSGRNWKVIDLSKSYRSTEAVLKVVDTVFQSINLIGNNSFKDDELNGYAYKPHLLHRTGQGGYVELWPLTVSDKEEDNQSIWEAPSPHSMPETARYKLARLIGQTVDHWITSKKILPSKNRPIEPQDIMILVRHRDSFLQDLVRVFAQHRIPISGMDRFILNEELAVQDLLIIGDFSLFPLDDLKLATLLKGPFFGLSDEDLLDLRQLQINDSTVRSIPLWSVLKQQDKYREIYERLEAMRDLAQSDSPALFYGDLLGKMSGREKILGQLGAESNEILEEFLNTCFQFEKEHGYSLQKFQIWIHQNTIDIKRQSAQGNVNQVRLMSVHGSKGLQAPIVFLPDTTQIGLNHSAFLWDRRRQVPLWAPGSHLASSIASVTDNKSLEEYYRLLYVGMTRAEDQLYVCGWANHKEPDPRSWYCLVKKALESIGQSSKIDEDQIRWFYETLHLEEKKYTFDSPKDKKQLELTLMPEWVHKNISLIESSHIRPSVQAPVDFSTNQNSSFAKEKGIIIHGILQWIGSLAKDQQKILIDEYIQKNAAQWADETQNIHRSIQNVLNSSEWGVCIRPDSLREVSVVGWKDGQQVRGIIDVLTVDHDQKQVFIIDYKTGTFSDKYFEAPPIQYVEQLNMYAFLLQPLYPSYEIKKILFWTDPGYIQVL